MDLNKCGSVKLVEEMYYKCNKSNYKHFLIGSVIKSNTKWQKAAFSRSIKSKAECPTQKVCQKLLGRSFKNLYFFENRYCYSYCYARIHYTMSNHCK